MSSYVTTGAPPSLDKTAFERQVRKVRNVARAICAQDRPGFSNGHSRYIRRPNTTGSRNSREKFPDASLDAE